MSERLRCVNCGEEARVAYYCDQMDGDGPWCGSCFVSLPCLTAHDEGCVTQVVETED
jgi:hypothetical protein